MFEVNAQTTVFLQSLALGAALGLFYDAFRIFRLAIRHSSAIIFLEDLAFFVICSVVTFLFALSTVNGRVRVFLMIGELLGATIYYFSLGALVMGVSKAIIRFVTALLRLLYRMFIHPFVRLFTFLGRKMSKLGRKIAIKGKKVEAKAKYGLKRRAILVYNLTVKGNHRGGKTAAATNEGGVPVAKGKKRKRRRPGKQSDAL